MSGWRFLPLLQPVLLFLGVSLLWHMLGGSGKLDYPCIAREKYEQAVCLSNPVSSRHIYRPVNIQVARSPVNWVILYVCLKIQPWTVSSLMHKQTRQCPRPDAGAGEDLLHCSSKNITTLPSWQNGKKKTKKTPETADQSEAGSPVSIRKQPCHLSLGVTADSSEERERDRAVLKEAEK